MKAMICWAVIAASILTAAPARAQDDKQELKKKILDEIAKKLDEESKRILDEISKFIDDEIAKFRGRKPADAPPAAGVPSGFLGVQPDPEQPEPDDFKAWKVEGGVRVIPIEGAPAAMAGVKEGDVIIEADGKKVREWTELPESLKGKKPGDKVTLKVLRGKETKEITVTLGKRPEEPRAAAPPPPKAEPSKPVEKPGRIGITPGDPTGKGMAIEKVGAESAAGKAGIQAGDVLAKLDATPIWKESDLKAFMDKTKPGQKVEVTILRGGEEKKFSVVLSE